MTIANMPLYTHLDRIERGLAAMGIAPGDAVRPEQLFALDQWHYHGTEAIAAAASTLGLTAASHVLDIGAGVGGPARYLTERTGLSGQVSFRTASALELPFDDGSFDAVLLQHVAMNISDRPRLYGEIRRVLKAGGRFATFDVVSRGGAPLYPVPWARTPATSFLLTAAATREAIEPAGFRTLAWQDDTEAAKAWIAELRTAGPPPSPNLGVVMGADFAQLATNLGRNLVEGRLGILMAVLEAVAISTR